MDQQPRHAVMIIDMPDATPDEIKAVFTAIRECAARSAAPGWPEELAVVVDEVADDFSERVKEAVASYRYSATA